MFNNIKRKVNSLEELTLMDYFLQEEELHLHLPQHLHPHFLQHLQKKLIPQIPASPTIE